MDMIIEHIQEEKKGCFIAIENGIEAGKMTYYWTSDDRIVIDHTEVYSEFGGRGVGKKLVLAGVDFARESSIKIIPMCSFVAALFDRITAIQDVKH